MPNPLERALGQAEPGPHPDADLLTAFSEDALLPRERGVVLAHLAHCVECRQVLSLADDAVVARAAVTSIAVPRARPAGRIVLTLAAAAVLIVGSTVALRYVLNKPAQTVKVATNDATAKIDRPAPPAPSPQPEKQPERKQLVRRPAPMIAPVRPMASSRKEEGQVASAKSNDQAESPRAGSAAAFIAEPPPPAALSQAETSPLVPRGGTTNNSSNNSIAPLSAQGLPSASAFADTARKRALAIAPAASVAKARWRINEQGQPERAFGNGPWQPVLPPGSPRMQALSVVRGEVWVGGESSRVLRSVDNGSNWQTVTLPEKDGTAHTIAHIRIDSAQQITIEASDGTTWSTTDGGATWQ